MDVSTACVLAFFLCGALFDVISCCPQGCQCIGMDSSSTLTVCTNSNLTSIPRDIPPDTEELFIKENRIKSLPQGAFDHLPSLKTLHITDCNLESISPNAFSALSKLTSLDLGSNKLEELEAHSFRGLSSLRSLTLDNNNIKTINNFAFHGLSLSTLGLEGNLPLEDIAVQAFDGASVSAIYIYNSTLSGQSVVAFEPLGKSLTSLLWQHNRRPLTFTEEQFRPFSFRLLNLNNNGITNTDFLRYVDTRVLALDSNPIGSISFSRRSSLQHLRNLQLQNTGISHLHGQLFKGLPYLEELHLSDNKITKLPENMKPVFARLQSLTLDGNPLHCNCELVWFKQWVTSSSIGEVGANCKTPQDVPLVDVSEEEMVCSAPTAVNISQSYQSTKHGGLTLTCTAHGDPAPWVTWELPEDHVTSADEETNVFLTKSVSALHIHDSKWAKEKNFTCVAENNEGGAFAVIQVATVKVSRSTSSVAVYSSPSVVCILCAHVFGVYYFLW